MLLCVYQHQQICAFLPDLNQQKKTSNYKADSGYFPACFADNWRQLASCASLIPHLSAAKVRGSKSLKLPEQKLSTSSSNYGAENVKLILVSVSGDTEAQVLGLKKSDQHWMVQTHSLSWLEGLLVHILFWYYQLFLVKLSHDDNKQCQICASC